MSQLSSLGRPNMALRSLYVSLAVVFLIYSKQVWAESRTFQMSIRSDDPASTRVLRASKGDHITIEWSTDKRATVHIHGYDIEQDLMPGTSSRSEFRAGATGRFPIEAHFGTQTKGKSLAYLEVLPR